MGYDFLPLPQQNIGINTEDGNTVDAEIERIEQIKNYGSKEFDYIDVMRSISAEMKKMRENFDAVRINTDTLTSKFPISAADQNLQRSWTSFSFNANWQNLNVNNWPCRHRKTSEGLVFVQGIATNTAGYAYGGANQTVATLPAGSRPVSYEHREIKGYYDAGYGVYVPGVIINVTTAGAINLIGGVPGPAGGGSGAIGAYIYLYFSFWAI